jgi:ureidoacrylate peracid hydrolase
MTLTRDRSALIVVDMQNGFLEDGGSMAALGLPVADLRSKSLPGTQTLVAAAREAGVPVIWTRYVYMPDYRDGGLVPNVLLPAMKELESLAHGSWDAEVVAELAPDPSDVVIDKSRPSAFYGTQLEPVLTSLDVRNLVIAGVTTNICVETTARDAGQRDFHVHVVSDASAEWEDAKHEHALGTIGFMFGWVNTVDEVLAGWQVERAVAAGQ